MVQWLRLCAPNAGGPGSTPGQGTKILLAATKIQHNRKKRNTLSATTMMDMYHYVVVQTHRMYHTESERM